jgi:hypothetical protein
VCPETGQADCTMADLGSTLPSPLELWPSILAFAATITASVLSPIASIISSTELQRKQLECEYDIKRLETIQNLMNTGKYFHNEFGILKEKNYEQEFEKIIDSVAKRLILRDITPQSYIDSFRRLHLPWRLLVVPSGSNLTLDALV